MMSSSQIMQNGQVSDLFNFTDTILKAVSENRAIVSGTSELPIGKNEDVHTVLDVKSRSKQQWQIEGCFVLSILIGLMSLVTMVVAVMIWMKKVG
jgi:hypothetical protein